MKSIAFGALKGGVGKTAMAVNIASNLAKKKNKKVLLVDFDPQANATSYLNINEFEEGYKSFVELLREENTIEEVVLKTEIENLDIIGSSILATYYEFALYNQTNRENKLKRVLQKHKEFLEKYDFLIFDTNPSLSLLNQNVFNFVDKIFLISEPSAGGLKGAELFLKLWTKIADDLELDDTKVEGIIINKVDKTTNISKEYIRLFKNIYDDAIYNTYITSRVAFKNAEGKHRPICIYAPKSEYDKQIDTLLEELEDKGGL